MMRQWLALAPVFILAACVRLVPEGAEPRPAVAAPPPVPMVDSAALAGVTRGPSVGALELTPGNSSAALAAFLESCPQLTSRDDASGLTHGADWQAACSAAMAWPVDKAPDFFLTHFETARVGDGRAFATGYFEPEIAGCHTRQDGCQQPVYAVPPELVRAWPEDIPEDARTGRPPLGRHDAQGKFVPYFDRAAIDAGALDGRGLEIAWAADSIEFFFLQIQGSGRLKTPEGDVIRIGYAGQNGREYVSIGSVMRERGLIGDGPGQYPASMQGIMQYLRENPHQGRELMHLNKSWVFFRILDGEGPLGALGVPVRGQSSVAADPRFVPLGAPVWLDTDNQLANRLWVAQDTGGAIKGANRFDTFWGAGEHARVTAGEMSARGEALILLPKGTVSRLNGATK